MILLDASCTVSRPDPRSKKSLNSEERLLAEGPYELWGGTMVRVICMLNMSKCMARLGNDDHSFKSMERHISMRCGLPHGALKVKKIKGRWGPCHGIEVVVNLFRNPKRGESTFSQVTQRLRLPVGIESFEPNNRSS